MSTTAQTILNSLIRGDFRLTAHALKRMRERSVQHGDIQSVGETHLSMTEDKPGEFRVDGYDLDGDELTVIAAFDGETLIITLK